MFAFSKVSNSWVCCLRLQYVNLNCDMLVVVGYDCDGYGYGVMVMDYLIIYIYIYNINNDDFKLIFCIFAF